MNIIFKNKKFRYLFAISIFVIVLEILGLFELHLPTFIELPIFISIIIIVGRKVLWGGLQALKNLRFTNMYLLMTIAIIGAMLIGEFEEAAVIVALFALSEALEDLGLEQSQSAIENLIASTPKQITLKTDERINIDEAKIEQIFIVKPGETIGLDGQVTSGVSSVDEASITGEPLPTDKIIGSKVFAGTVNMQGFLEIKVTKRAEDTTIKKIAELTQKAASNKANYQKFIEKFSNYYTPTILVGSILMVIIPIILGGDFSTWFARGITLLVIACPCALVISTPISIFSAVGNASAKGILIKGGRFLEEIGQVKAIAFDKTRTLTYGRPRIEKIITYQGTSETEILACAAGMESQSEHPMGQAVIDYAKEKELEGHTIKNFKAITGKGVQADCLVCEIGTHLLGNLQLLVDNNHEIPKGIEADIKSIQETGQTPLILADKGGIKGIIVVSDEVKPESIKLMSALTNMKITPIILTGDSQKTANTVARELDISNVYGDLLPEDKVSKLIEAKKQYGTVSMVGDGVNDAPVLASSNVGIALGAVGSDIAIESADIALMNDRIDLLPFLIKLGRKTKSTIQVNVALAITTKLIAIVLTILGIANLALAIFADVGVTFLVVLLSLQLLSYQASHDKKSLRQAN
ncbi:MAG TPA: cation-translocating P-type ATPase [Candidatus Woesebacteria bacterium]|nr:cation-translocating P-type ATPase [Candidatus Woesebacteria bacterium]